MTTPSMQYNTIQIEVTTITGIVNIVSLFTKRGNENEYVHMCVFSKLISFMMGRSCSQKGRKRSTFKILTGKPIGKRSLGRPKRRWDNNIKMDFKEICINTRNWVDSTQDRDYLRSLVNATLNLRVPQAMELIS